MEEAKVTQQMLLDALKGEFKTSPRTYVERGTEESWLVLDTQT